MRGKLLLPIKGVRQRKFCCGPACVEMVLQYYGYRVTQEQVRKECRVWEQRGMFPHQVIDYLAKYGIIAKKVKKINVDKYLEKPRPAIIGLKCHFTLLVGKLGNYLIIIDPASGRKSIVKRDYLRKVKDYTIIQKVVYDEK